MSYPVRTALAGIGGYGGVHLKALEALEQEGKVKLVAVADPRCYANQTTVARLRNAGVRVLVDWHDLLNESVELLLIAAPVHLHVEMTIAALRRGLHVFCEKPAGVTVQDVEAICQAERESGKKVEIGFQYLTGELLSIAARLLAAGELGRIKRIVALGLWQRGARYFSRNGWAGKRLVDGKWVLDGPMNNALIHQLNNALFLAGAAESGFGPVPGQPVSIAAPARVRAELYRATPWTEMEDTATLALETEAGTNIMFLATYCSPQSEPASIFIEGERGRLWWTERRLEVEKNGGERTSLEGQPGATSLLIRNMVEVVAGIVGEPLVPVTESRKVVRATNGAYLSSGRIHPVDAKYTQAVEPPPDQPQADHLVVIPGLNELFHSLAATGSLPSDFGVPWAVRTRTFAVAGLTSFDFPQHPDGALAPARPAGVEQ